MTVHQLSVFVENKSGTLLKVLELLKEAEIQLIASTISDTVEYGIYRIICSDPQRAFQTLNNAGISQLSWKGSRCDKEFHRRRHRYIVSVFVPAGRKRYPGIPY